MTWKKVAMNRHHCHLPEMMNLDLLFGGFLNGNFGSYLVLVFVLGTIADVRAGCLRQEQLY
jgi:hypothetical protein